MNREQFNSALDGISDDLIDAAAGAYERKNDKKKWFARGLCVACIGLLLVIVGLIRNLPAGTTNPSQPTIALQNPTTAPTTDPQPTISVESPTTAPAKPELQIVYLSNTDGQEIQKPLVYGVEMPLDNFVYVRDVRGMTKEEWYTAVEEWEDLRAEKSDPQYVGVSTAYLGEDMIVGTFMEGSLGILVDRELVQTVYVNNVNDAIADKGWGWRGDIFNAYWFLRDTAFQGDPTTPLSSFHDTLNFTVMYKDGTSEVVSVDISVTDEGQIVATLIAEKVSA